MMAAVTDHALLRYLERVVGLDVEAVRRDILSDRNRMLIDHCVHAKIPLGNGHRMIVRDATVVTIL